MPSGLFHRIVGLSAWLGGAIALEASVLAYLYPSYGSKVTAFSGLVGFIGVIFGLIGYSLVTTVRLNLPTATMAFVAGLISSALIMGTIYIVSLLPLHGYEGPALAAGSCVAIGAGVVSVAFWGGLTTRSSGP